MHIFKKYVYFSSFEAGNCVSNSSFKWRKIQLKRFSRTRVTTRYLSAAICILPLYSAWVSCCSSFSLNPSLLNKQLCNLFLNSFTSTSRSLITPSWSVATCVPLDCFRLSCTASSFCNSLFICSEAANCDFNKLTVTVLTCMFAWWLLVCAISEEGSRLSLASLPSGMCEWFRLASLPIVGTCARRHSSSLPSRTCVCLELASPAIGAIVLLLLASLPSGMSCVHLSSLPVCRCVPLLTELEEYIRGWLTSTLGRLVLPDSLITVPHSESLPVKSSPLKISPESLILKLESGVCLSKLLLTSEIASMDGVECCWLCVRCELLKERESGCRIWSWWRSL